MIKLLVKASKCVLFTKFVKQIGRDCQQSFGRGGVSKSQWAVREYLVALPAVGGQSSCARSGAQEVAPWMTRRRGRMAMMMTTTTTTRMITMMIASTVASIGQSRCARSGTKELAPPQV